MSKNQKHLKMKLRQIVKDHPNSLLSAVAVEALDYSGDITIFFADLLSHGCQSGMINSLTYYHDTHKFYDTHYHEIEALREEMEDEMGKPLHPNGDLKNWFSWLAFEETSRFLYNTLEKEHLK